MFCSQSQSFIADFTTRSQFSLWLIFKLDKTENRNSWIEDFLLVESAEPEKALWGRNRSRAVWQKFQERKDRDEFWDIS